MQVVETTDARGDRGNNGDTKLLCRCNAPVFADPNLPTRGGRGRQGGGGRSSRAWDKGDGAVLKEINGSGAPGPSPGSATDL